MKPRASCKLGKHLPLKCTCNPELGCFREMECAGWVFVYRVYLKISWQPFLWTIAISPVLCPEEPLDDSSDPVTQKVWCWLSSAYSLWYKIKEPMLHAEGSKIKTTCAQTLLNNPRWDFRPFCTYMVATVSHTEHCQESTSMGPFRAATPSGIKFGVPLPW